LRSANVLRVGFPLGFLAGPLTPDIRAQKDFFLEARLPLGFDSVTGGFSFEPVLLLM